MATRLRKTRKYRGSRNHGWGQIGQHRASGHKGGLGQSGLLKHHFSTMLKDDPDHFGHNSNNPPQRNIIKKWINIRDLDDLYFQSGKEENGKKILDLTAMGIDKLLGSGQLKNVYTIKVKQATNSALEKIKKSNGEIIGIPQKTEETPEKKID